MTKHLFAITTLIAITNHTMSLQEVTLLLVATEVTAVTTTATTPTEETTTAATTAEMVALLLATMGTVAMEATQLAVSVSQCYHSQYCQLYHRDI